MNTYAIAGMLAGVLSLGGYIPYIIGILKGETRPNIATWFIWTIVGGLLAFSFLESGGDLHNAWLPFGYFIGPFIIAILAIRYGYNTWSRLDILCLIAAIISIIPWLTINNPSYTLIINIFIDAVGAIPTLIKSWKEPETEDFTAWTIFFIANTIQLLATEVWNISSTYTVYLFLLAGSIFAMTLRGKLKRRKASINKT